MEGKECSACHRFKGLDEFYESGGRHNAWCKQCFRDWHLRRYPLKVLVSETLTCQVCGVSFTPKQRKPAKYCSLVCRNQARIRTNRALREARLAELKCEWCDGGLTFRPGKASRTKYCSDDCQARALRARRTPEIRAAYRFKKKYGITLEQRDALLKKQGGGCAICGTADPGARGWAFDHDHACCPDTRNDSKTCGQCLRGVLCGRCNLGIGLFDDDPARLRAAVAYLKRHSK